MHAYIVLGSHPWCRKVYEDALAALPGRWTFLSTPDELTLEIVRTLAPRYMFFLHWSWRVPQEMLEACECVCFHMTDLPYGRGGSPLQNLILLGHTSTRLTALRMTNILDAGPVYMKRKLSLRGNAQAIYLRAMRTAARMIKAMIATFPAPAPQQGDPIVFRRRTPAESEIPKDLSGPQALFDFIRMLDAEGYPQARLDHGGFRFVYSRASMQGDRIRAHVEITPHREDGA